MKRRKRLWLASIIVLCVLSLMACETKSTSSSTKTESAASAAGSYRNSIKNSIDLVPMYSGSPYVAVNDNQPCFTAADLTTKAFELYSELDSLGRCGVAYANICQELMPTKERGAIGQVKPTGWHSTRYNCVDGKYLYNRCHLIGYQLAGENANEQNLITGTRALNIEGMLPFENMVTDYVKETNHHVLYRVTPVFEGDNLVATGVFMEGYSVEDRGEDICFNTFCYNVQPEVVINYATGNSKLGDPVAAFKADRQEYILNTKTHRFHNPGCSSAAGEHTEKYIGNREDLISKGYKACGRCKP